jgi:hypothetical protein
LNAGRGVDTLSPFSSEQRSPSVSHKQENNKATSHQHKRRTANDTNYNANAVTAQYDGTELLASNGVDVVAELPLGLENEILGDELATVSHTLLDQQFADMDRVFTLNGTDFTFGIGSWDAVPLA